MTWQETPAQWTPAVAGPKPMPGLTLAASILVGPTGLCGLALAAVEWQTYGAAHKYVAGTGTSRELRAAFAANALYLLLYAVLTVASAVLVMIWTWRARENAELGFTLSLTMLAVSVALFVLVARRIGAWQTGDVSRA